MSEVSEEEHEEHVEHEAHVDGADEVEGSQNADEGPASIPASDEMAAALREAEESVDERHAKRSSGDAPEAGDDSADKMTIELLAEELQSLKGEHEKSLASLVEAEDKHLRLHAEFDNFRRRTIKEKQDTFKYGAQNLVKDLLATVDNLERAVAHGEEKKEGNFHSLLEGVELVRNELLGILNNHGVVTIEAENQMFDPGLHEAMAQIPSDEVPINTVMQVLQTGYMLRDRMLRPARVIVSKAVDEAAALAGAAESEQQQDDSSGDSPEEQS